MKGPGNDAFCLFLKICQVGKVHVANLRNNLSFIKGNY